MKNFVLLLLFSWFTLSVSAQLDHFSNPDAKWYVHRSYADGSPYDPSFVAIHTEIYGFEEDTTISGEKWLKLFSTYDSTFTSDLNFEGYVFSKNDLVEFIDIQGKKDTLYDFSTDKQDSVYFVFKNGERHDQFLNPDSIGSILIGGQTYKTISFEEPVGNIAFDHLDEMWIRGIGSIHGPLHPLQLRTYSHEDGLANEVDLVCTTILDTLIFSEGPQCFVQQDNDWKSWYKIGTKWHINLTYDDPPNLKQGYEYWEVTKDTLIQGVNAKCLEGKYHTYTEYTPDPIIVYESNNQAYYWTGANFQLMYDFNLDQGDTLNPSLANRSYDCDSSFVIVDSTTTLNVGSETLKVQFIGVHTYDDGHKEVFTYEVIERIGLAYTWTFGSEFIFNPEPICNVAIDNFWNDGGLRCYEEPNGLSYNAKPYLSRCDVNTSANTLTESFIQISPNPSSSIIRVEGVSDDTKFIVSTILGEQVKSGSGTSINVQNLNAGIYILHLESNTKRTSLRFVKQ